MGKKEKEEKIEKETLVSKTKLFKVKFKNFTNVSWKMYKPWQVAEFDSISWFERLVSIVE